MLLKKNKNPNIEKTMKTRINCIVGCLILLILLISNVGFGDLSEGIIADYPFNGNANDESGNLNHGTAVGATLTNDQFGNVDSAYSFDGYDDEIRLAREIPATTEDGSWSVWVKPNSAWGSGVVLGKPTPSLVTGYIFYFYYRDGYSRKIWVGAGIEYEQVYWESYTEDMVGVWNHLLLKKSGSTLTLYVNGINQGNRTISQITPISTIGFGQEDFDIYRFDGSIDEVRIYDRALSEIEIQQLAVIDETPPEVICELAPIYVDDDEGLYMVMFEAVDDHDSAPIAEATLTCGAVEKLVHNGKLVWLEADDDECSAFAGRRILYMGGSDIQLSVIATDASGNVGTCTAYPTFEEDDDDGDDGWDDDDEEND